MLHLLLDLLAPRSDRLASQLAGYGALALAQAGEAAQQLRRRAWMLAGLVFGLASGLGLAGMAALLAAAVPLERMAQPGLLVAVPAVPLAGAALCAWLLWRRPMRWGLDTLRARLSADAAGPPSPPGGAPPTPIDARALVRAHPVAAMLLAAGAGSAIAALRPWRWRVVARSWRSLQRMIAPWLVAQLGTLPLEHALSALVDAWTRPRQDPGAVPAGPSPPSSAAAVSESSDTRTAPATMGAAARGA